jgi:uncharacterized membrane protein HdeD (DUF308 family)
MIKMVEIAAMLGTMGIMFGIIGAIFAIRAKDYGMLLCSCIAIIFTILIIITPTEQGNCECTNTHNCEHQITYTYQCKLCNETVKQTEEPKIKLCDECIATIKEIESEED